MGIEWQTGKWNFPMTHVLLAFGLKNYHQVSSIFIFLLEV
jgi:hypothetical protein